MLTFQLTMMALYQPILPKYWRSDFGVNNDNNNRVIQPIKDLCSCTQGALFILMPCKPLVT